MIPYSKQSINNIDLKYVKDALKSKFLTQGPLTVKFEKKIAKLIRDERAKVPFAKRLIGNSEYGDTNPQEWFAEQFSAYTFGMTDKVHPSFIKLIKEIEDEVVD